MVAVQVVLATLVQRHHAAAHRGLVVALAVRRKLGGQSVLRILKSFTSQALGGTLHLCSDVSDLLQLTHFSGGAL